MTLYWVNRSSMWKYDFVMRFWHVSKPKVNDDYSRRKSWYYLRPWWTPGPISVSHISLFGKWRICHIFRKVHDDRGASSSTYRRENRCTLTRVTICTDFIFHLLFWTRQKFRSIFRILLISAILATFSFWKVHNLKNLVKNASFLVCNANKLSHQFVDSKLTENTLVRVPFEDKETTHATESLPFSILSGITRR